MKHFAPFNSVYLSQCPFYDFPKRSFAITVKLMATLSHLTMTSLVWSQCDQSSYFVSSLASPQRVQLAIPESLPWLSLTELAVTSGRAISVSALQNNLYFILSQSNSAYLNHLGLKFHTISESLNQNVTVNGVIYLIFSHSLNFMQNKFCGEFKLRQTSLRSQVSLYLVIRDCLRSCRKLSRMMLGLTAGWGGLDRRSDITV